MFVSISICILPIFTVISTMNQVRPLCQSPADVSPYQLRQSSQPEDKEVFYLGGFTMWPWVTLWLISGCTGVHFSISLLSARRTERKVTAMEQ